MTFFFVSNSSLNNYTDDNRLYTFGDNLKKIKNNLRNSFDVLFQPWLNAFTNITWRECWKILIHAP